MNVELPEMDLERVSTCLREQVGLHFPRERWGDMERGLASAARDFECKDPRACVQWLLSSPLSRRQIEVLACHLTVGETYFFREKAAFEPLETRILPELVPERGHEGVPIRIWSAGCASGEEPYSIAISLDRLIGPEAARRRPGPQPRAGSMPPPGYSGLPCLRPPADPSQDLRMGVRRPRPPPPPGRA